MKKSLIFFSRSPLRPSGIMMAQSQINQNHKLRMAEAAISQFYVDTVNESKLVEDAIKGMLEEPTLTPNTPTRRDTRTQRASHRQLQRHWNYFQYEPRHTIRDSDRERRPSERVGILAGDRIIAVNDTAIAGVGMKNSQIVKRLRGKKGSDVDVKVLRQQNGSPDTIDFTITRADIPIYSVEAAYMVDPKTGYIRINRFTPKRPRKWQKP